MWDEQLCPEIPPPPTKKVAVAAVDSITLLSLRTGLAWCASLHAFASLPLRSSSSFFVPAVSSGLPLLLYRLNLAPPLSSSSSFPFPLSCSPSPTLPPPLPPPPPPGGWRWTHTVFQKIRRAKKRKTKAAVALCRLVFGTCNPQFAL